MRTIKDGMEGSYPVEQSALCSFLGRHCSCPEAGSSVVLRLSEVNRIGVMRMYSFGACASKVV